MGSASSKVKEELTSALASGDAQRLKAFLDRWQAVQPTGQQQQAVQSTQDNEEACFFFFRNTEDSTKRALQGLDLNAMLPVGCTPLQQAARSGMAPAVRQLLAVPGRGCQSAVNVNGMDTAWRTPLHYAARHIHHNAQCAQCIADLLHNKADPCIADSSNSTALDVARRTNCLSCVRTLEDKVKLWQGWVDHYEPRLLVLAKWTPKWLVVLQDRRPNSGTPCDQYRLRCPSCASEQKAPPFVAQFQCGRCGTPLSVTASCQLAIYEPTPAAAAAAKGTGTMMILPDTAVPTMVLRLPQFAKQIKTEGMTETIGSIAGNLFKGNFRRTLQHTFGSDRAFGLSLNIFNDRGVRQGHEHNFRVGSEAERADLIRILSDPLMAAYEASVADQRVQVPASPSPSAPPKSVAASVDATLPSVANSSPASNSGAASSTSAGATQPPPPPVTSRPTKTSGYELRPPAVVSTSGTAVASPADAAPLGAAASSSAATSTPGVCGEDGEEGLCVVCLEKAADTAVIPCGHMCGCGGCLQMIRESDSPQCPLCRGPLTSVIRIYAVS